MRCADPAARWRGAAVALLTVALSVGAHGMAGGGAPSGAAIALVVVLAAGIGALAAAPRRDGAAALIALLAAGQILDHLLLVASGHSHAAHGAPTPAMLAAHTAAVMLGAVLVTAGSRLCRALSRVVRALTARSPHRPQAASLNTTSDQPLQSLLLLVGSMSYRGPPVSALR